MVRTLMQATISRIPYILLLVIVLLLPIFVLPFGSNIGDFPKQLLLGFSVLVALGALVISFLQKKEVELPLSLLFIPVVLFLGAHLLSLAFSGYRYASFWGFPFPVAQSVATVLGMAGVFVLILLTSRSKGKLLTILYTLITSGIAVTLFAGVKLFYTPVLSYIPEVLRDPMFFLMGNGTALALSVAVLLPIAVSLFTFSRTFLSKIFFGVAVFLFFAALIIARIPEAWAVLLLGLLIVILFEAIRKDWSVNGFRIIIPFSLFALALFFLVFRISVPGVPQISSQSVQEFGYLQEIRLLERAYTTEPRSAVWGVGPAAFEYGYAQFRPQEFNVSAFWNTRFQNGASEVLDQFLTTGIMGGVSLLSMIGVALYLAVRISKSPSLLKESDTELSDTPEQDANSETALVPGVVGGFAAISLVYILFSVNITLSLLFWVLLGTIGALSTAQVAQVSFAMRPFARFAFLAASIFLLVFGGGFAMFQAQRYGANVAYAAGLRALGSGDTKQAIQHMETARSWNPSIDLYARDLGQLYFLQTRAIVQGSDFQEAIQNQEVEALVQNMTNRLVQATVAAPNNSTNWVMRGFVLRNLIGALGGADSEAIKAYSKAGELDPTNPYIPLELARISFFKYQIAKQQPEIDALKFSKEAIDYTDKAIELKADYAPAHVLRATVYKEEGNVNEAISRLETALKETPQDIGVAFQLGMFYWYTDDFTAAQGVFEYIRNLRPNYSNARYMLGLAYDKQGKKESAQREFQQVLSRNPENGEVRLILQNLKQGKTALEGIAVTTPPVEEQNPTEIQNDQNGEE